MFVSTRSSCFAADCRRLSDQRETAIGLLDYRLSAGAESDFQEIHGEAQAWRQANHRARHRAGDHYFVSEERIIIDVIEEPLAKLQ
jgi:hypothetical protein